MNTIDDPVASPLLKDLISSYDDIYETEPLRETEEHYRWVLEKLNPEKGTSLLDVASGGGYFLREAAKRRIQTVGIDFSRAALKLASREVESSGLICGDAQALPFKNAVFDYVTSLGSLEHFLDPERGVQEMARVLKNKGRAAVLVPNSYFLMTLLNVWRTGSIGTTTSQKVDRPATRNAWQCLFERNGLDVETVHKYNYRSPRASWKYRLIRPLIPLNLSYCFLFLCRKP